MGKIVRIVIIKWVIAFGDFYDVGFWKCSLSWKKKTGTCEESVVETKRKMWKKKKSCRINLSENVHNFRDAVKFPVFFFVCFRFCTVPLWKKYFKWKTKQMLNQRKHLPNNFSSEVSHTFKIQNFDSQNWSGFFFLYKNLF